MTFNRSHNRYLRHGRFLRLRHGTKFESFLDAQAARLASSASGSTFTTVDTIAAVAAAGTLTNDGTNVTDGDTVTIGSKVYTIQSSLTNVDGHVHLGASNTATMTNLFHAINGTGGTAGTDYAAATTANAQVTATNPTGTTVVVTAKTKGTAANSIATTEASTHLAWGGLTLTGGIDEVFDGHEITMTTSPYDDFSGPVTLSNSGGALPAGLLPTPTEYFVEVVDSSTARIALSREALALGDYATYTDAGTGTHTMKRSTDRQGIYELLRRHSSEAIVAATDIDSLR